MPDQEPSVITLNETNSIQILAQYVEVAQQKGAYLLSEAEVLKRAMDVLINNVPDKEIDKNMGTQLLIQGVNKGQRHGSYTLNDAALLSKVVLFLTNPGNVQSNVVSSETSNDSTPVESQNDDLSDLAEPIPLKPKEV